MKYLSSQIGYFFTDRTARVNLGALARYVFFLSALVTLYAILFHVIMARAEGQEHSWFTGFYWTLTVMTTLGFGDIAFTSDVGRVFSVVVLLSGVVFLLVMLPFLFIQLFYAPWLEARVRMGAPREVKPDVRDHVIITEYDAIAVGLVERLRAAAIPYVVIEPDPAVAVQRTSDGIAVVTGEVDASDTYRLAGAERARILFANREDTANTNITLTVREVSASLPIAAVAEDEDAVDILQLSGATHVLPLKRQLGEFLASRADTGLRQARIVGRYKTLCIAEIPASDTPFVGMPVKDTRLRETLGMSVLGVWKRGKLLPAYPLTVIDPGVVLVLAGTEDQIRALNERLPPGDDTLRPVVIIGSGAVGYAAAEYLKQHGVPTHVVDRDPRSLEPMRGFTDRLVEGDAADRRTLESAGLSEASSILLTTNDDAMNIYLAVFCRRLRSDARIVSRITYERNIEAIHRAGADFVLSYASLGAETVFSLLKGHELVILAEGVDLFTVRVPRQLEGRTLADGQIGSLTGLVVLGLQDGGRFVTEIHSTTRLPPGGELVMIGNLDQRRAFGKAFPA